MVSGEHYNIPVNKKTRDELMRIKYSRGFKTMGDVVEDLINDDTDSELVDGVGVEFVE